MAAERVARLEKEAQSLKRVSEEVFRVQKQIDGEKLERESASGQLQSDLQQLLSELHAPHYRTIVPFHLPLHTVMQSALSNACLCVIKISLSYCVIALKPVMYTE